MGSAFEFERDKWSAEVDAEAARLVQNGMPPYAALDRAKEIVSARRRRKAGERITDEFLKGSR